MEDLIGWLNLNQGFVLVILTLVYVVTTAIMASLMMRSNRLTRELEEQRSRPAVIFNVLSKQSCVHAILKNTGLTPAYDVEVTCTPSITSNIGGTDTETAVTAYPVSFLAPQQEIADFVDVSYPFYTRYPQPVFTGTVRYKNRSGKTYREDFRLDLTVMKNRSSLTQANVGKELEKIRKTLESGFKASPLIRTIDEKEYKEERRQLFESHKKRKEDRKGEGGASDGKRT